LRGSRRWAIWRQVGTDAADGGRSAAGRDAGGGGGFERYVESGRYEELLRQPEKFEEQEKALLEDGAEAGVGGAERRFETRISEFARGDPAAAHGANFRDGWGFD
jgi:hypothetical protein